MATIISMVSGPVVARAIGADGKGLLATASTVLVLLSLLLAVGFPMAIRKHAAQGREAARSSMALGVRFASAGLPVAVGVGVAVAVVADSDSSMTSLALVLAVSTASLGVLRSFATACLTAVGDVRGLALTRAVPPVALAVVSVALALLGRLTVTVALVALACFSVVELAIAVRYSGLRWSRPAPLRRLLPFSLKALPGQLAESSAVRIDQVILFTLVGTSEVGRYSVAVTVAALPVVLLSALQARDFTRIASASGAHALAEAALFVRRGVSIVLVVSLPLAALAPPAVALIYGSEFSGLTPTIVLLVAGTVLLAVSYGGASALVALGRPGAATIGWASALAATAVLEVPFVWWQGITGAAVVSVIAYAIGAGVHVALLRSAGVGFLLPSPVADLRAVLRGDQTGGSPHG